MIIDQLGLDREQPHGVSPPFAVRLVNGPARSINVWKRQDNCWPARPGGLLGRTREHAPRAPV
jgi:hypothetical protein